MKKKKKKKKEKRPSREGFIRRQNIQFKLFVGVSRVLTILTNWQETIQHHLLNVKRPFLPV